MGKLPFALQLYTVRDHLEKNPAGTLERVKDAGYDYVELAGIAGKGVDSFRKLLDANELTAVSSHISLDILKQDLARVVDDAHTLGIKHLAFSAAGPDRQGWLNVARTANDIGARLHEQGLRLSYHNHAHEFEKFDDEYALDLVLDHTDPDNLSAQIDVYWAHYGGADPVQLINRYKGRCPTLHIKDMADDTARSFAEVGHGVLPMHAIFRAGTEAGTRWYIVEQDVCPRDSLESARMSATYMAHQQV